MNRTDEVIEIEDYIATFFENLDDDISFTSEEIDSFHANLRRLEELDSTVCQEVFFFQSGYGQIRVKDLKCGAFCWMIIKDTFYFRLYRLNPSTKSEDI